jgi:molybdopterin biosynthesis enzyme
VKGVTGLKKISVEKALGMTLAHDITEIIPGKKKDVAFSRGKIIEEGDIEKLLDLGKRYLYVFEGPTKGFHEDDASTRIAQSILGEHMEYTLPKEGKVSIKSTVNGLFYVNTQHLFAINRIKDILLSTLPSRHIVKEGDIVAATRIIPLYIDEKSLKQVERIGEKRVIRISPFKSLSIGLVITGSEVYTGRVKDGSSVVEKKLRNYGLTVIDKVIVPDEISMIKDAILKLFDSGADLILTTAGLSVDPDDVTKEGIEATGAETLFYGTPVFPGAMFLVARLRGKYILGAPACVYYNRNTVLDIVLTRILAGERMHKSDMVKLSYGGLCMQCKECHYPTCFFGKGL